MASDDWVNAVHHGLHHVVIDLDGDEMIAYDVRNERDARLMAAAPDLLAALEAVEWVTDEDDPKRVYCPWCGNYRKPYGHSPECEREIAIAKAKGDTDQCRKNPQ